MGRPIIDYTGQRFGAFLVLGPPIRNPDNTHACTLWPSRCDCGAVHLMRSDHLKNKTRKGCVECIGGPRSSHRMTGTSTYATWARIKRRCLVLDDPNYPDYGARGITMSERWQESFENFLTDMGEKPARHMSIDRIDNDLLVDSYSKANCRWATPAQQSQNRRSTRLKPHQPEIIRSLHAAGVPQTDIARQLNVPATVIYAVTRGRSWRTENS